MTDSIDTDDDEYVLSPWASFAFVAVAAFFVDDVLGLINRGGMIVSTGVVYRAVERPSSLVSVDDAAFRTIFILAIAFAVAGMTQFFHWKLTSPVSQAVLAATIGFGYLADSAYDSRLVTEILAKHGYERCAARDFLRGHGKGSI